MKTINFSKTGDIQNYVNFINDNNLAEKLINFETGYQSGSFFIDIEGPSKIIEQIRNLSIEPAKRQLCVTDKFKYPNKYNVSVGQIFDTTKQISEITGKSSRTITGWTNKGWLNYII